MVRMNAEKAPAGVPEYNGLPISCDCARAEGVSSTHSPAALAGQVVSFFDRRRDGRSGTTSRMARSARLTAAPVGKTSAISGSSTTMMAPLVNRLACLPRSPPPKSYSARISATRPRRPGLDLGVFFIGPPFAPRRQAGANEANPLASFKVYHHQQALDGRAPDHDESCLLSGMVRIRDGDRMRIGESRHASSNATPCFRMFAAAFLGSHSNSMSIPKATLGEATVTSAA